jgi:hypothetical protein
VPICDPRDRTVNPLLWGLSCGPKNPKESGAIEETAKLRSKAYCYSFPLVRRTITLTPDKKEMKDNPIIKLVNYHIIDYPTPVNLSY